MSRTGNYATTLPAMALRIGIVLTVVLGGGIQASGQHVPGSCGVADTSTLCSSADSWKHPFYDCCAPSLLDYEICDPCCGGAFYVSSYFGATAVDNFHRVIVINALNNTVQEQGTSVLDGYLLGTAVGYRVHPRLRLELDYTFRRNEAGDWFTRVRTPNVVQSLTVEEAAGDIDSHSLMFNSVFDLSRRRLRCANLYGGGGLGILGVDSDLAIANDSYNVSDTAFAWQLLGGVNFPMTRKSELYLEYRYTGADKLDVTDAATGAPFGDFDYDSHNVLAGVRLYW